MYNNSNYLSNNNSNFGMNFNIESTGEQGNYMNNGLNKNYFSKGYNYTQANNNSLTNPQMMTPQEFYCSLPSQIPYLVVQNINYPIPHNNMIIPNNNPFNKNMNRNEYYNNNLASKSDYKINVCLFF